MYNKLYNKSTKTTDNKTSNQLIVCDFEHDAYARMRASCATAASTSPAASCVVVNTLAVRGKE